MLKKILDELHKKLTTEELIAMEMRLNEFEKESIKKVIDDIGEINITIYRDDNKMRVVKIKTLDSFKRITKRMLG